MRQAKVILSHILARAHIFCEIEESRRAKKRKKRKREKKRKRRRREEEEEKKEEKQKRYGTSGHFIVLYGFMD